MTNSRSSDPRSVRWSRVSEIFDAARELAEADRSAFLDTACAGDPGIREEVEQLLRQADSGTTFLDGDAVSFAAPAWEDPSAEGITPEGRLGPYRVIERLAWGGMSVVYLVERDDDQFRRTAALKILDHTGLDPDEEMRRFRAERQILATLDHPNIAAVYDGGIAPDGRPYLVLEYVPGEPITTWCEGRSLSLERRLDLFETVCRAVQHAHQRFVVHRDLKPGNILVRDDGTVKLLDFGIAKILEAEGHDVLPVTRTGLRLLTPEYAAPEQVRGEVITSATDVYALGVLLYELLAGTRPYDLAGLPPSAVEKTICDRDPPPPSAAVARSGGSGDAAAARKLRGDLDTIVMTALRKEPRARYPSPGDLADDVRRHRRGLAIEARSASVTYLVRRFLWRYRFAAASVAAVLTAVILFGIFHVSQVTRERNIAREEAAKSTQVSAFLQELFELSDPDVSRGEEVTARNLLDRAVPRVRADLAGQPEVQAEMLMVLGDVYRRLSLYEQSAPLIEEAWRIRRARYGDDHPETAACLELLGRCRLEMGQYAAADSLLRLSYRVRRDGFGADSPQAAASLQRLGVSALDQNRYERADSLFRAALEIWRAHPEAMPLARAETLKDLGMTLTAKGDLAGAEPLLREALEIRGRLLGDDHSGAFIAMTNLGDNLSMQGRYDEAVPLLQEGAHGLEQVLGTGHSEVAEGLNVLGIALIRSGRYDEAVRELERALEIRRRLHGDHHPDVARGLNDLAVAYLDREDFASAEPILRESLDLNRTLLGEENLVVAIGLTNLANALRGLGRYDESMAMFRRVEEIYTGLYGADSARAARARLGQATVVHERGDAVEAESRYRALLGPYREFYPDGHRWLGDLLVPLGRLLRETGRPEEALAYLEEGAALFEREMGEASLHTAKARVALGACLMDLGRYERADSLLQAGLAVEAQVLAPGHPVLREARAAAERLRDVRGASGADPVRQ